MLRNFTFTLLVISASAQTPPADSGAFLLKGGTVHTVSGATIENGAVLVRNGKIVGVGKNLSAPEGVQVIDITGQQVYPGMIDAASFIGRQKPSADQAADAKEMGLFNPQIRAATAMNPDNQHIPGARANGVTSVIEMPDGELLAGQMSLVHLEPGGNDAMVADAFTAIHLRFPAIELVPRRLYEPDADDSDDLPPDPRPYAEAKQEYDTKIRALNQFFENARRYRRSKQVKSKSLVSDLRYEALLPVLEGSKPLLITAVREREIREAVAWAEKQKVKMILADGYESYKVIPLLKAKNIPVVLGPTMSLPLDEDDPYDRSNTTPGLLYKGGVKFCIATFSALSTRNLPYQAAAAVGYGLPHDEAFKAVSLNAAEIFGLGKRYGSIDEGKVADLIVTDGDPMEAKTKVNFVFIDGKPVSVETRQKQLYEKYKDRK